MGSMFAYSKFKQNLSKWIPLKLKDSFYIFSKCDIAEPYWTDEENRKKAIDAYNLHKELSSELISDKANNKPKKLKI
jgi:hypothetical protein